MVDYNLRSKGFRASQDRDVGPRRKKKAKVNEGTSVEVEGTRELSKEVVNTNEVVVINSDSDSEASGEYRSESEFHVITGEEAWLWQPSSDMEFDFHNFERDRRQDCFVTGNIWAIYDEYGMPRRYVQIDNSSSPNSLCVTFLKQIGLVKREEQNITKETGLYHPVCGTFGPQSKGLLVSPHAFSHIACHHSKRIQGRLYHFIYPKKGDVWAIFKNVDKTCSPRLQKYQLVEILTDYDEEDGMKVVYLVKSEGRYRSIFRRLVRDISEVSFQILGSQLDWLSHQIPSFKIEGTTNVHVNGCYELDPSSVPLHVDDFTDGMEPKLTNKLLCLKFLDNKSLLLKEKFKDNMIWAAYDDRDSLPRRYAVITETVTGRECTTWLEPCPITEDEKNWYKAGHPVGCGTFRLKKTITGQDRSMFSHPMQYNWDSFGKQYEIYPRKGEVWAIYRGWEMRRNFEPKSSTEESKFEYDFVEILTDFDRNEGVRGVYLVKMEYFSCLFERQRDENGVEIPFTADGNELYRFSYRVLHCKIQENSGQEVREGSLLLDPLVVFQNAGESSNVLGHLIEGDIETKEWKNFIPGQVWALYDDSDWIPRCYAIVNKTFPAERKVQVTMLKPHPVNEDEMEWVDKNLPLACGTFRVSREETVIRETSEFSHLVTPCEDGNKKQTSFYKIFPKEGEVWATYEDLEIIKEGFNPEEPPRYHMVEIISNSPENSGVSVASLVRVEGPDELIFRRQLFNGFVLIKSYSETEMRQFSHQVVDSRIVGDDGDDVC